MPHNELFNVMVPISRSPVPSYIEIIDSTPETGNYFAVIYLPNMFCSMPISTDSVLICLYL